MKLSVVALCMLSVMAYGMDESAEARVHFLGKKVGSCVKRALRRTISSSMQEGEYYKNAKRKIGSMYECATYARGIIDGCKNEQDKIDAQKKFLKLQEDIEQYQNHVGKQLNIPLADLQIENHSNLWTFESAQLPDIQNT